MRLGRKNPEKIMTPRRSAVFTFSGVDRRRAHCTYTLSLDNLVILLLLSSTMLHDVDKKYF